MTESEPFAMSTCRLCRTADAKIRFTVDLEVIDVVCEGCGRFRVAITGYNLRFDSLSAPQRLRVLEYVRMQREPSDPSPLVPAEFLQQVIASG